MRTTPPKSLHLSGSSVWSMYFYENTVSKVCISTTVLELSLGKVRSLPVFYQINATSYPKGYSMEMSAEAN